MFFISVTPEIAPFSNISNSIDSVFKIYPAGAIVSRKVYFPIDNVPSGIFNLPEESVTALNTTLPVASIISIVAPSTGAAVVKSLLERTT